MNEDLYQPDGVHDNFQVYASKPEPKKKQYYRFVNKNGDKIGNYNSVYPERTAKKVLRQIFYNTGIDNPIYHIYNEDTRTLYKYAGKVENAPRKARKTLVNIEYEDGEKKKINIPVKYKYIVRQIEYKKL